MHFLYIWISHRHSFASLLRWWLLLLDHQLVNLLLFNRLCNILRLGFCLRLELDLWCCRCRCLLRCMGSKGIRIKKGDRLLEPCLLSFRGSLHCSCFRMCTSANIVQINLLDIVLCFELCFVKLMNFHTWLL